MVMYSDQFLLMNNMMWFSNLHEVYNVFSQDFFSFRKIVKDAYSSNIENTYRYNTYFVIIIYYTQLLEKRYKKILHVKFFTSMFKTWFITRSPQKHALTFFCSVSFWI